MMGALFQKTCYASQAEAVDAFFTSVGPQYSDINNASYFFYAKYTTGWHVCQDAVTGGAASCAVASIPVLPACEQPSGYENFSDGMVLGWGVVAAMFIAWGFKLMQREAGR